MSACKFLEVFLEYFEVKKEDDNITYLLAFVIDL
jgi:hypothetical protein